MVEEDVPLLLASKKNVNVEDYDYFLAFLKPPYALTRGVLKETLLANRITQMKRYYIIAELLEMLQNLEDAEKKALAIIAKFAFPKGRKIGPIIDGDMRGKFKKSDAPLNVTPKNA
jgi:hypothetical protein